MRYIPKPQNSSARRLLDESRDTMRQNGISETYDNFGPKRELNDLLRQEQKHICCYCQKQILHHYKPAEGGSHNEHFYPEKGAHAHPALQLDYENIYACCNTTMDLEERLKHCGWSKHDTLLSTNFLADPNCSDYFKYNADGEITPVGPYQKYNEFCAHRDALTPNQQEILKTIDILKLNIDSLKLFRRQVIADVQKSMIGCSKQQLQHKLTLLNLPTTGYFVPMVDLVMYIIKKHISRMH